MDFIGHCLLPEQVATRLALYDKPLVAVDALEERVQHYRMDEDDDISQYSGWPPELEVLFKDVSRGIWPQTQNWMPKTTQEHIERCDGWNWFIQWETNYYRVWLNTVHDNVTVQRHMDSLEEN